MSIKLRKSIDDKGRDMSEKAIVITYQLMDIESQYISVANIAPIIYNRSTMDIWVNGLLNDEMGAVRGAGSFATTLNESLEQFGAKYNLSLSRTSPEVVIHTQFSPYRSLPFVKGTKNVLVIFDAILLKYPNHFPAGIRGNFQWWMNKFSLHMYDSFLTISETSKLEISQVVGIKSEKIYSIGCAAKKIFYEDQSNTKTKLPFELPQSFVLYVGDVTWNKNLLRFAKAVVQAQIPAVFVGKALTQIVDSKNKWTKDLASFNAYVKKYPELFTIVGKISDIELVEVYKKSSGVCLPSLDEGFGLPWLEAALLGKPVVLSNIPVFQEISKSASLYFDPNSVDDIARTINVLMKLTEEEKRTIICNQKTQTLSFSQETFVSNLVKVICKVP